MTLTEDLRCMAAEHMLCVYRYRLTRDGWDVGAVDEWSVTRSTATSGWTARGGVIPVIAAYSGAAHPVTAVENLIGTIEDALARWRDSQRPASLSRE